MSLAVVVVLGCLSTAPAFADACTLAGAPQWNVLAGTYSTPGNWNPVGVPAAGSNVCLTNGVLGTPAVTTQDINASVSSLQVGQFNTLNSNSGTLLTVAGPQIINAGSINLSNQLQLTGNIVLSGAGTLTLQSTNGNTGQIGTNGNQYSLTNQSTIAGTGLIGSNASSVYPYVSLINSGTVNANSSGNILTIGGSGSSASNMGLLEATGGGILDIATPVAIANNGGNITANGTGSTVDLSTTIQGGTLNTLNGGVIQTSGTATLDATANAITISNGSTYTAGAGSVTKLGGTLNLGTGAAGNLALGGQLQLIGNTTLTGPGMVIMSSIDGNTGQIGTNGNPYTLNNQSTIIGSGLIGSNASSVYPYVSLNNSGTINANSSSSALTIGGAGSSTTNTGLLEAASGGTLNLATSSVINNSGGVITANGTGSTVNISTTIEGGTLNTLNGGVMQTSGTATLDASSHGAILLSDGSTYTAGAGSVTKLTGTLNLGTVTGSTLALGGQLQLTGDTTLTGPGTLVMTSTNGETGQIGTNGNQYALNNQITIEGSGLIGSNASSVYPYVSLNNSGTVNANSSGNALTIGGSGSSTTNTGLFEATNGGVLNLATVSAINNETGNITANGVGSTVNISTTIQGGTLNTLNGGVMQTNGTAVLDAATKGAITLSDGSTYTAAAGTVTEVKGSLILGSVTGSNFLESGQLQLTGNTTLSGPGALKLASINGSTGQIGTNGNSYTLNNQSIIEGSGLIGSNASSVYPYVSLNNTGSVLANSSGNTLTIGSVSSTTTNTGLFEAVNGGILDLSTTNAINNIGGNITAAGVGSTVNVATTIQGGTLNTSGGGVMQTASGSTATLDGSQTNGAITISDGSTYGAGAGPATLTKLLGTLNLGTVTGGTLALSGQLELTGNATVTGPGALRLDGGTIGTNGNAYTLTNQSTISGFGTIGANTAATYPYVSLTNSGTVNAVGGILNVAGPETATNTASGIMEAQSGALLHVSAPLSNYAAGTLTNGAYEAFNGTIQIDSVVAGTGILQNAADIVLSGPSGEITNQANLNALASLQDNLAAGSFTVENGQQFITDANGGAFENDGTLDVGGGVTPASFTTAGGYNQGGGSTQVDGTLTAPGGVSIAGGTLFGTGTVVGNVTIGAGGTLNPGDSPTPGTINITGNYTQAGTLDEGIAGTPGSGKFDVTRISGTADLGGTVDVSLLAGFTAPGTNTTYSYTILDAAGGIHGTFALDVLDPTAGDTYRLDFSNPDEVILDINGPAQVNAQAPEPIEFLPIVGIVAGLIGIRLKRRNRLPLRASEIEG